jgi:hypothetical protein
MKKVLFTIVLFAYFFNVKAEKDSLNYKNEGALVLTDFIDAGAHIRYERKLGRHFSVLLSTAYKGEKGLINISGLNTPHIKTDNINYSGFKIMPELRYYLKKTQQYSLDGFYAGMYSKSIFYNSSVNGTYSDHESDIHFINISASIRIQSYGFLIGYKLAVNKRFNIDFVIAGGGVANYNIKLKPRITLPDDFYSDLSTALSRFSFFDLTDPDIEFNFESTQAKFSTVSFRYGLAVGFCF